MTRSIYIKHTTETDVCECVFGEGVDVEGGRCRMKVWLGVKTERMGEWRRVLEEADGEGYFTFVEGEEGRDDERIIHAVVEPLPEVLDSLLGRRGVKRVLSVWAGVDAYVKGGDVWDDKMVVRVVGKGLGWGMADYVVGMTYNLCLNFYDYGEQQRRGEWKEGVCGLSSDYKVTVLGLGKMGRVVAERLRDNGFCVRGYSRTKKEVEGVRCYWGEEGLREAVRGVDVLVCVLPLYEETKGIVGFDVLGEMAEGSYVINVGRGGHVEEEALRDALESGRVRRAVLDVFEDEPLRRDSWYWRHEGVVVTPHVASLSRARDTAEDVVRILKLSALYGEDWEGEGLEEGSIFDRLRGY